MKQPAIFEFESADSMAQFGTWMIPLGSGGFVGILLWSLGGIPAAIGAVITVWVLVTGLRASICVRLGHVTIVRKWFFIPYRSYSGSEIEDVWFGGDYGLEDDAMGVVVKLAGKEIHIGTSKNMRELHAALSPLSSTYKARMANKPIG